MSLKNKRAVKVFLINSKKEILLQLRDNKPGIYYPGYWGLLGGAVENNESELAAAKREIKEEINLEIKNLIFIGITKSLGRNKNSDVYFFKSKINIPLNKIKLNEGQKVEFFKLKDILKLRTPNFLKKFICANQDKILS